MRIIFIILFSILMFDSFTEGNENQTITSYYLKVYKKCPILSKPNVDALKIGDISPGDSLFVIKVENNGFIKVSGEQYIKFEKGYMTIIRWRITYIYPSSPEEASKEYMKMIDRLIKEKHGALPDWKSYPEIIYLRDTLSNTSHFK